MVWDEAGLVTERRNGEFITEAVLLQLAVVGVFDEKGNKAFGERIENMRVAVKAIARRK